MSKRSVYELTADELRFAINWLSLLGTASETLRIVQAEMAAQLGRLLKAKETGQPIEPEGEYW